MEKLGGLSTDLKEKIAATKVVVIGKEVTGLIARAIRHMGFIDVTETSESLNLPKCDVVICICTEKEQSRKVITHYYNAGVPVICAFNFGIGACVTIVKPGNSMPHFLDDKAEDDTIKSMLEYTDEYSKLCHIPNNRWVNEAMKYICTPEVRTSIGEYTMTAMAAHLLIATEAGNKVKTYPKFYLSTIANDVD